MYCSRVGNILRTFTHLECTYCIAHLGTARLYDLSVYKVATAPFTAPSGNRYCLSGGWGRPWWHSLSCSVLYPASIVLFHSSFTICVWPTRSTSSPTGHSFPGSIGHFTATDRPLQESIALSGTGLYLGNRSLSDENSK